MSTSTTYRIRYLTKKAQRNAITSQERKELARLLGRDPKDFERDNGSSELIAIGLVAIAIALLADMLMKKN
jgi:hypothetical protein